MLSLNQNNQIVRMVTRIADLLEIAGGDPQKVGQYRKIGAHLLKSKPPYTIQLITEAELNLDKETIAVVQELIETGKSSYLSRLEEEVPVELLQLLRIPGLTPQKVGLLFHKLEIKTLKEIEQAAKKQQIRQISGFGAKTEMRIRRGIRQMKNIPDLIPIVVAMPIAQEIKRELVQLPRVSDVILAGSLRRMKELVEEIKFVITTEHSTDVAQYITQHPKVIEIISQDEKLNNGEMFLSIRMEYLWPIKVELLITPPERLAPALIYLTGSKEHYAQLKNIAENKGHQLTRSGLIEKAKNTAIDVSQTSSTSKISSNKILDNNIEYEEVENINREQTTGKKFDDKEKEVVKKEAELYQRLGLSYIPPEIRVGEGEINQAATEEGIPTLIHLAHIQGDLHMHTNWSDGGNTIEEMAEAAYERGYAYIAITDHSRSLKIAGGLSIERLMKQKGEIKEIEKRLRQKWGDFSILCGVEVDILSDGELDYPDEVLREMDIVIGSIHTSFDQDEATIMKRLIGAIRNHHVDLIAHPTGRIIAQREGYPVDLELLFKAAQETGTVLELNGNPERLDLKPEYIRRAIEDYGILITINTDAHEVGELCNMEIAVGAARRGWITPQSVINTWPLEKLQAYLRRND